MQVAGGQGCEGLRLVAMRLDKVKLVLLALLVLVLALVWYDGGREPQRLIEQPVELPESMRWGVACCSAGSRWR